MHAILAMLARFAAQNPGMTRVLIGDALVNENERLQARINALMDKIESSLKQSLRVAVTAGELPDTADVAAEANLLLCFTVGRWHQFAKSGFKKNPVEGLEKQLPLLVG